MSFYLKKNHAGPAHKGTLWKSNWGAVSQPSLPHG